MDAVKEGSIYKTITIEGTAFEIRYGYYCEGERALWQQPTPLFPDFIKEPQYTADGRPYVTAEQDICKCYKPKDKVSGEMWCDDCIYFEKGEEIIGVCGCKKRKITVRKNE